jgi:hypothetical protein
MFGTPLVLRCERCNTNRRDTIDNLGQIAARSYVYPENYRYDRGLLPTRSDFRLRIIAHRLAQQDKRKNGNGRKRASA